MVGRLITLEGIDGCGKTTQCALLAEELRKLDYDVLETREPTNGHYGQMYRQFARGEIELSPEVVLGLFVADRRQHLRSTVFPALAAGQIVLCDRYEASTRAYQLANGVDRDTLQDVLRIAAARQPDLALWLVLPLNSALQRMGDRRRERFENEEFLLKVISNYADDQSLVPVNAGGAQAIVTKRLLKVVRRKLAL